MYVFKVQISPVGTADLVLFTPRYWNSLFHSLISLARMQLIFCSVAIHTVPIFVPPGTHYCWVDRGSVDSKLAQGLYT